MRTPLISIIVPIYKVEKYLEECIESLIRQTYSNIEILLIVDGSPDNSAAICEKAAKKDSRIRYIYQENAGVSVARNNGIEKANGEYLLFVDGDDWCDDKLVELLWKNANTYHSDVSMCGYYQNTAEKEEKKSFFEKDKVFKNDKLTLLKACFSTFGVPWSKLYKKSFLLKHHLTFVPNLKRMQDSIFNLNVFHHAEICSYIDQPLYHYRMFNESVTNKYSEKADEVAYAIIEETTKFIQTSKQLELDPYCQMRTIYLLNDIIKLKYLPQQAGLTSKQIKEEIKKKIKEPVFRKAIQKCPYRLLSLPNKVRLFFLRFHLISFFYWSMNSAYQLKRKKRFN